MNRLDVVAGPNGAGKSTFIAVTLAPLLPRSVVVNADEIARQRWPDDPTAHSYDAARTAADTRAKLIVTGRAFIAETVFSHPSKLDLVRSAGNAGYVVALHVMLIPENLAVERVRQHVLHGGHHVPKDKIRARHRRMWPILAEAIELADIATVYDNSRLDGPRIIAQLTAGVIIGEPAWPAWAPGEFQHRW
ncbi:zeta toxin family protein [Mycobacterium sp.]|uniref:zeta toxin family protein n=1 Tax=Mycobacterium sp. TaxID=1785 RepID=UPI003A8A5470